MVLMLLCITACDPPAAIITYVNGTPQTVAVYEVMGASKTPARTIAPGASMQDQVFVPGTESERQNARPRHIEATTETGAVIFCANLSYRELDNLKWRVTITSTGPCS